MLTFDPLEQFSIELYSNFCNKILFSSFSSIGLMAFFVGFLIIIFYYSLNSVFFYNKFQKSIFTLFQFIIGIIKDSLVVKKHSFILIFSPTFLFIFISNILGMFPYSMTITSRFIFKIIFYVKNKIINFFIIKYGFFFND